MKLDHRKLLCTLASTQNPFRISSLHETLASVEASRSIQHDLPTFSSLLQSCSTTGTLSDLRRIHHLIVRAGLLHNHSLARHVVQLYIRFRSITEAHKTFMDIPNKQGVVLWTAMISGYVKEGLFHEALTLFHSMQRFHVLPDKVTYVAVLGAVSDIHQAKALHIRISESGYDSDLVVCNALVKMYVNCCSLKDAACVFEKMEHKDVVSWTAMISAFAKYGHFDKALMLFRLMQLQGGKPNKVTYLALLTSCGDAADGMAVYDRAVASGFGGDVPISNAVLNMYARCGCFGRAEQLFGRMPVRNTVSWTGMIAACVRNGETDTALKLFRDMQDEQVEPDWITFITVLNACTSVASVRWIHGCIIRSGHEPDTAVTNAVINSYTRSGSLKEACRTFAGIPHKDHVSWTAMISGYVAFGRFKRAMQVFREMQLEGVRVNDITIVTMANACANATALQEGRLIHEYACQKGLDSTPMVATAFVNMYAKCGSVDDASGIFNRVCTPDVVLWTSMVACYAHNGRSDEAAKTLARMQAEGVKPVDVSFVSIVAACSHAGLLSYGSEVFSRMIQDHGIRLTPEHCGCAVDLLGRAGKLEEAEYFIDSMPFKPTPMVWMAFLSSCKTHGDAARGHRAAAQILGLDPTTAAAVVALSQSYAASGRDADVESLRKLISVNQVEVDHN